MPEEHPPAPATTICLVQSQLDAARGDQATRLPVSMERPAHWPSSAAAGHSG
jgi:hypothetical protein